MGGAFCGRDERGSQAYSSSDDQDVASRRSSIGLFGHTSPRGVTAPDLEASVVRVDVTVTENTASHQPRGTTTQVRC